MNDLIAYEKKALGVCAYLADKLSIDVKILRVGWIVATILGVGSPIFAYFLIYFIIALID